jgi:hypothetical protein
VGIREGKKGKNEGRRRGIKLRNKRKSACMETYVYSE